MNVGIDPSGPLAKAKLTSDVPALTKLAWTGGLVVMAAYCVLFILLSPLPVQDFPDHLARAVAMNEVWYGDIPRDPVDWGRVAREYDYLAVTKPYDPSVFKLTTHPVAESPSAILLAIDK